MRLVLLPGLDGTGVLFRPFLAALPSSIQPIVIPLPGLEPLGYPDLVRYVKARLPRSGPYVLLGESFSGPLALFLAAESLRGLCGVVLCATFVLNPTVFPAWLRHLAVPSLFRLTPVFIQTKVLAGGCCTHELWQLIAQAHRAVSPAVMAHRVRSVLTVDATDALRATPVPLCYLRGTKDLVVPAFNVRRISAIRPDVRVHPVPAPHLVLQMAPEIAALAVSSFISELHAG